MWVFVAVRAEGGVSELFVVNSHSLKNELTALHQRLAIPNSAYLAPASHPPPPFSAFAGDLEHLAQYPSSLYWE